MQPNGRTTSRKLPLSAKARRTTEPPISYLIAAAVDNPRLISFAAGLVDPETLPAKQCAAIAARVLADNGQVALQYDTTRGLAALRRTLLQHLEALENKPAAAMGLDSEDLVITTGSQQALYLIGDTLIDPGDIVITANPSYFVYAGALASLGACVRTVPMDAGGMDVEAVGRLLEQLKQEGSLDRVKLIYCTSYFQNPTGLTLAAERRPRLLEIAQRFSQAHRILILEDAAYRELCYDGRALPSIKSFNAQNQYTILAQTFSKPFAPGLKTGYAVMPQDLRDAVLQQKGNHDFGSANLCQQIVLEALRDGSYARHVQRLCQSYRAKRDLMLETLDRFMPQRPDITWTRPHGGLYVWLTLPPNIDTSRNGQLFQDCLDNGVLYVPGEYCFQGQRVPQNHLRLSFGQVAGDRIATGIQRLGDAVKTLLEKKTQLPSKGVTA